MLLFALWPCSAAGACYTHIGDEVSARADLDDLLSLQVVDPETQEDFQVRGSGVRTGRGGGAGAAAPPGGGSECRGRTRQGEREGKTEGERGRGAPTHPHPPTHTTSSILTSQLTAVVPSAVRTCTCWWSRRSAGWACMSWHCPSWTSSKVRGCTLTESNSARLLGALQDNICSSSCKHHILLQAPHTHATSTAVLSVPTGCP